MSNLVLPPGFSLQGSFPTSINAGASAIFTVQLDTARAGEKFGQIRFNTNEVDEVFNFNVQGTVTGAARPAPPVRPCRGRLWRPTMGGATVLAGTATLTMPTRLTKGGFLPG